MTLPPGVAPTTRLGGRYRLVAPLAAGGMGHVWRGADERTGTAVALKILRAEYAEDPSFRTRFRAEAHNAAMLTHPGVTRVFDYGESDGVCWIAMELVDGQSLQAVLSRGPLPVSRALHVIGQAALALAEAHAHGLVHRDVKPANLLLCPDGRVKVTDFGIARAVDAVPLTRVGTVFGTAQYLAPEQARGERPTPAVDVYALGVVGYECLSGRRPFDGDNPLAIATAHATLPPPPLPEHVPMPVRQLIEQALAKEPHHRPASAAGFGHTALTLRDLIGPRVVGRPMADGASSAERAPEWADGAGGADGAREPAGPAEQDDRDQRGWLALLLALTGLAAVIGLSLVVTSCSASGPARPAGAVSAGTVAAGVQPVGVENAAAGSDKGDAGE